MGRHRKLSAKSRRDDKGLNAARQRKKKDHQSSSLSAGKDKSQSDSESYQDAQRGRSPTRRHRPSSQLQVLSDCSDDQPQPSRQSRKCKLCGDIVKKNEKRYGAGLVHYACGLAKKAEDRIIEKNPEVIMRSPTCISQQVKTY